MTRNVSRQWRRVLLGLAATAVLVVADAPPAGAWTEQWWISELGYDKAWTLTKGAGVTVAVVDTGVVAVPDLAGHVLPGKDLSGAGTDGRSDAGDKCQPATGCYGHGTDMALAIAGSGKGAGYQGAAPEVNILPVKVQTRTGADVAPSTVAAGIRWATDHGARIINLSLGSQGVCPTDEGQAISYAYDHDVIVVAAAGNEADAVSTPANCPGALAITASDRHFRPWTRANDGPELAFTAVGVDVPEESLTGSRLPPTNGTSEAAALASGTFALLRAHFPTMSARDIVTRALWNVHNGLGGKIFAEKIKKLGYGQILPYHALVDPLPATATNPIYQHWAGILGQPSASASAPSTAASGGPAASPSSVASQIPAAGGKKSSSNTGAIVGGVAAAVVVIAAIGALLVRRSRRPSRAG